MCFWFCNTSKILHFKKEAECRKIVEACWDVCRKGWGFSGMLDDVLYVYCSTKQTMIVRYLKTALSAQLLEIVTGADSKVKDPGIRHDAQEQSEVPVPKSKALRTA